MADRILIVEDDSSIARGLELNLGLEGFEVKMAADGPTGLRIATDWKPDLIVLDLMLPVMNGYEVCREIRRRGMTMPIVVLSARSAEQDKVMGLEIGADDFVTKPFGLHELLARLKAQLRRARTTPGSPIVRFGDVEADFATGEVRRRGQLVELTAREVQLLQFFTQREGRVITRQMILDGVWGENYFGTERTIDNFITRLRQKLDEPEAVHFLTVRGVGYRFKGDRS